MSVCSTCRGYGLSRGGHCWTCNGSGSEISTPDEAPVAETAGEAVAWLYTENRWVSGPRYRLSLERQAISEEDKNEFEITEAPLYASPAPASPLPEGGGDMDWQSVAMWMGFSASVIKSGEPWSDQCQQHFDEAKAAFARLAAPTGAK